MGITKKAWIALQSLIKNLRGRSGTQMRAAREMDRTGVVAARERAAQRFMDSHAGERKQQLETLKQMTDRDEEEIKRLLAERRQGS